MLPSFLLSIQLLVWQGQAMCCEPNKKKKDLKQNYFEGYFMINGNPQQYISIWDFLIHHSIPGTATS